MASHTQEPSSPSASSIFLPLGRRSRRGSHASITSEAEKENLTEALDQIHSAASQMGTLTVFNEYTNPPVRSVAVDNKGLVGDLQGGLSGLYNIFKASVGGVREMVGGPSKATDAVSQDAGSNDPSKTPVAGTRPVDASCTHVASAQASATSSPVMGTFPPLSEGTGSSQPKTPKVSSKAASISSKASIPAGNPLKSPLLPLSKVHLPATADPTVTEINVNAVKDGHHHHRSNSGSLSSSLLMNSDAMTSERKDRPSHLSSSQISQESTAGMRSQSPVLLAKAGSGTYRDFPESDFSQTTFPEPTSHEGSISPKLYSNSASRSGLSELDTSMYTTQQKLNQAENTHDDKFRRKDTYAEDSNVSLAMDSGPTSISNSMSKFDSSTHDGNTIATLDTSVSMTDRGIASAHSSKASISAPREKLPPRVNQPQLPRFVFPSIASSESSQTVSTTGHTSKNSHKEPEKVSRKSNYPFYPRWSQSEAHTGVKNKLLSKEFWMRDENAKDCFYCGEPFSTFRRKHHCRVCGQIFDAKCTALISGSSFGYSGSIRVCKPCDAVINAPRDDSSDFSGDEVRNPVVINTRGLESPGNSLGLSNIGEDDAGSTISQSLDHVLKTPTMAIPATRRTGDGNHRRSAILEIDSDRQLARPTSSRSLKSGLSRSHSVPHKRHHSRTQYIRNFKPYHDERAPFQRRFGDDTLGDKLPAFHRDNIIDPDLAQYLSDDASSEEDQPSLFSVVGEGSLSRSGGDEKASFGGLLAAVKKGRSRFGDKSGLYPSREVDDGSVASSRAINLPRSARRRNLSVASSVHQRISPRSSKENPSLHHIHDINAPAFTAPANPATTGFKMTRSASMRGAGAPAIELNKASLDHVRKLLHQQLRDSSVPNCQSWETALLPILLKATDDVEPDVQHGDDMDIRHYVKLKKIPGGRPSDTAYVSGLVFTKNLALKSMPRNISHPRILIVTFALEYARQQQHFMSLEPVIRQEREFLENLVNRIAAHSPNLLLVTKHVSGLALQLLEKANIATVCNVKESVVEAVSRCTQTRIITSMDRLAAPLSYTGYCGSFDLKTYVYGRRKKTYMYISGCPKELGCTIVLRGANIDILMEIKRITEFMVYVVYNLKLETCLMRDEFAKIPSSPSKLDISGQRSPNPTGTQTADDSTSHTVKGEITDIPITTDGDSGNEVSASEKRKLAISTQAQPDENDVPGPAFYEDMVEKHQVKLLSASPFVKFHQPYLLMRARALERQLAYLKRLRDQDFSQESSPEEKTKSEKFFLITPEMIHESLSGASSKVKEVIHAVHDAEYDRALHHYETQKRQWEAYISGNINLFDPHAHQNIVVLYSLVCTKTSIPCSGPDTFALGFYNQYDSEKIFEADCTLGQYVEDLCHSANAVCAANGCEERMFEHHRQYVHGEAQVSVFVQPYPSKLRGLQDTILMWSCCKKCGNETPAMPMSDSTWRYSFGKYLELSFSSADLHARAGVCPHDLHRDHLRYFGLKDMALRIHYDPINLLEIIVPRPRVTWKVDKDLRVRNEVYLAAERRVNKFMASVKARLKSINVDSVMPEIAQACQQEVEALNKRANDDHVALIKQHQARYMDTRYWEVIPLNTVIISTQEKVVEWDAIFAEFERNYFPSEKDIRRLATLQLKKIFLDRDVSVTSLTSSEDSGAVPVETEEGIATPSGSPRLTRRMTLSPQEAKNMLASVVEEHTTKPTKQIERDEPNPQTPTPGADSQEPGDISPMKPIIASENEFRHLDLAIPSNLVEKLSPSKVQPDELEINQLDKSTTDDAPSNLPINELEIPSEPRSSVDSNSNSQDTTDAVKRPSGLPRPRDKGLNNFRGKSPPLMRALSQPAHSRQLNSNPIIPQDKLLKPTGEKAAEIGKGTFTSKRQRFSERLRLAGLKSPKLPGGPSLIPRSVAKKSTHVSYLTRHFEELSREFQKERIMQNHRRAAQGKQSRAYPMASSKPIVEVYKNVRDAVEEREPGYEELPTSVPTAIVHKEEPVAPTTEVIEVVEAPVARPETPDKMVEERRTSDESLRDGDQTEQNLSGGEGEDEQSDGEKNFLDDGQNVEPNDEATPLSPDEIALDLKELPKHERTSLVKMLTNFWAERSASGWAPLDYPLSDSDHVFADCDIIVREDEPSSLIAFALNSEDYQQKLRSIQEQNEASDSVDVDASPEVEQSLLRSTGTHLKYQFQEGQAKMLCKVFYAEQFDALRRKCGVADRIVESLSRCMKWDSKGGKTKSVFLKTLDDRFILKSLSTIETQAFLKFAPDYFQIMSEALFHELPSVIAKMFGFYQVIIKNPVTGVEFNWFLLIMENLFYDRTPTRIFDLKGSMRNRKVQSTGERNEVLLDENMVEFIYESPLFTREHSKKLLSQSVWNDTLFLARQNVMDYSLMIAIDESKQEIVVGIIDCIRTYTWDKKLESWIKDRGFAGGGKNRPTVTSPKEYKSRFREAMARYVLYAPDSWHQFHVANINKQPLKTHNESKDAVASQNRLQDAAASPP
ncbi:1-phosphatidylinositol-3-phosphate 5-kinase FAB1 [Nannizzia gypsea CBS 118893]|uniref:1-phosphatidylinositol-3-phosphate 5-kinase n=1 Tax=Arthroderma gypseum (strain ATCC MYA-4604 / CBS 118893) TaxID=535722 RepID=E4V377_ARTGP|nr:1-phosphatidylinositol-3-phosphate 5-kinase FAB1 [Nannizzia gypsea CBS 118893]EFR04451.1 1-phosphatidylinositol-3-phosphate 5-kinase FAB1 [Nannizzia gypsea CBS 118893]